MTLVVSLLTYPLGTRKFLAPFDAMSWTAPMGRSVWQLSLLVAISFVIWRVAAAKAMANDDGDEFAEYLR